MCKLDRRLKGEVYTQDYVAGLKGILTAEQVDRHLVLFLAFRRLELASGGSKPAHKELY